MEKIKKCPVCGTDIASSAKSCPHCGAKNKKPIYTRAWFYILIAFIVVAIVIPRVSNFVDEIKELAKEKADEEKGINVIVFEDGTKMTVKEICAEYDQNSAAAEKKYLDQFVSAKMKITYISEYFITGGEDKGAVADVEIEADYTNIFGMSFLSDSDMDLLYNLKVGDIILIEGQIKDISTSSFNNIGIETTNIELVS